MSDPALRQHLIRLLEGKAAHLALVDVICDLPFSLAGGRPPGSPHTPWRLLEHIRVAQWDILEFSRNPKHVSPEFPAGYWPDGDAPPGEGEWKRCIEAIRSDLLAMQDLVRDARTDLFAPIPHGEGQTILREALLVADHNAYHLGQLVLLRRMLEG